MQQYSTVLEPSQDRLVDSESTVDTVACYDTTSLTSWRHYYASLEIETIPDRPNDNRPLRKGFRDLPSDVQWAEAPLNANLGVLCGRNGNPHYFDGDGQEAKRLLLRLFKGLGIDDPPYTLTPHGGIHLPFYSNFPEGFTFKNMRSMQGEMRVNRCQVCEPPSVRDGKAYRAKGDWRRIQFLEWKDILRIGGLPLSTSTSVLEGVLLWSEPRPLPDHALRTALQLQQARRGQPVMSCPSRSEALRLYWRDCFFACYEYDQARKALGPVAWTEGWLRADWERVLSAFAEERAPMASVHDQAAELVSNPKEAIVLQACARMAWRGGPLFELHKRDVARNAGLPITTTYETLLRLESQGLLEESKGEWGGWLLSQELLDFGSEGRSM